MNGKRRFKCTSCGIEFEVAHGTGRSGAHIHCPSCGAQVYRLDEGCGGKGKGFGRGGNKAGGRRGKCAAVTGANNGADFRKEEVLKSTNTKKGE